MNLEKWEEAEQCATAALEAEPNNVKALYRRASALISGGNPANRRQAKSDLQDVLERQPLNAAAKNLLLQVSAVRQTSVAMDESVVKDKLRERMVELNQDGAAAPTSASARNRQSALCLCPHTL